MLLDAAVSTSVVGTTNGLDNTDALLNIQHDMSTYFGPEVSLPGVTSSGEVAVMSLPWGVTVDLAGVTDDEVTLFFQLLAFGVVDSFVVIDDVQFINADEPDIVTTPTSGLVTTEDGGVAQFEVVLTAPPSFDVTVPIASTNELQGVTNVNELRFTPQNWDRPQTVVVTGRNDDVVDGDVAYTIETGPAQSDDPAYSDLDADDVSATNLDNDHFVPGILVNPTDGLITSESGSTATFDVVLTAPPTSEVTVRLFSTDLTEGTIEPNEVTFDHKIGIFRNR